MSLYAQCLGPRFLDIMGNMGLSVQLWIICSTIESIQLTCLIQLSHNSLKQNYKIGSSMPMGTSPNILLWKIFNMEKSLESCTVVRACIHIWQKVSSGVFYYVKKIWPYAMEREAITYGKCKVETKSNNFWISIFYCTC